MQIEEDFELLIEPLTQLCREIARIDIPSTEVVNKDIYGVVAVEGDFESSVVGKLSIEGHCRHNHSH
jgi:hypothetical protein